MSATTGPSAGAGPPAALFHYSRDRRGEHPERHLAGYAGILQADAYSGFDGSTSRHAPAGAVTEALCWAHGRRKFFELADIGPARAEAPPSHRSPSRRSAGSTRSSPSSAQINGRAADERLACRQEHSRARWSPSSRPGCARERAKLSRHADVAKAMDYMLKRWPAFTRFLDDGRICLTNNAAERALRGIALGRKSWLFAGSDRGGERAAVMYTLIDTAKLNDVDPQAWLADVLARIADHPASTRLHELMPWQWASKPEARAA